ncbi:MAG: TIGR00730 family Rossman fold protein [Solirubrobacteraceae bacterium]|nr:TIGR00730 family Rossman fold protein [Solirubrobacteraceae bacterium]
MPEVNSVCVYAGSSAGRLPAYAQAAAELGALLARRGIHVVYGGGDVGLMGVLADAALAAGGRVTGIIPRTLLRREVGHGSLTELVVVETMHERKHEMARRADAFVALPGGIGTVEELVEALTWTQLGVHRKPCALLNAGGYWTPLIGFLDHAVDEGFLPPRHRAMLVAADTAEAVLAAIERWEPPEVERWLDPEQA